MNEYNNDNKSTPLQRLQISKHNLKQVYYIITLTSVFSLHISDKYLNTDDNAALLPVMEQVVVLHPETEILFCTLLKVTFIFIEKHSQHDITSK